MILKDIIKKFDKSTIKAGTGLENGRYPLYTCSPIVNKFLDNYLYDDEAIIVSTGGNFSAHYIKGKFNYSTDCYVFNTDKYNLKYLYYYLLSKSNAINKMFRGAGLKHLNKNEFVNLNIKDISIDKQENIVNRLDKINQMITLRKKEIDYCNYLIKSQFVEMFDNSNYDKYSVSDVCESIIRGPFGSTLKKEFFVEKSNNTYKVYEQKNAINADVSLGTYYIDENKFNELKRFECKSGDIIMSCSGTIGRMLMLPNTIEKGVINQALLKLRIDNEKVISQYFIDYIKLNINKLETKGTGLQNLGSVSFIKDMIIPVPPIEDQIKYKKIVEQIDKQKFVNINIFQLLGKMFQKCYNNLIDFY